MKTCKEKALEWNVSPRSVNDMCKKGRIQGAIKEELIEIKDKYGDERRSIIEYSGGDVSIEDLIADENVVVTISHAGYIKRTNLSEYKTQNRGGVWQKSAGTVKGDVHDVDTGVVNTGYV